MNNKYKIDSFSISGTRDFYPADLKYRNWLFNIWNDISISYGYEQYDTPIVENVELYTKKSGTDDIINEMYIIKNHNDNKLTLRPEMTPSFIRLGMEVYKTSLCKPLKWFSIAQCWRYETTIRGRKREHYQWNVDILGANDNKYELELFLILIRFFKSVGLTYNDIKISLSDKKILSKILEQIGISNNLYDKAFNIIDKIKKLTFVTFKSKMIDELNITEEQVNTIYNLIINTSSIEDLYKYIPENDECFTELNKLLNLAKEININLWLTFDISIVRGLTYYTGLVFEGFFINSDIKRSVCGGGRYDKLVETYGYKEQVPVIGFGLGDVVMLEVLGEFGLLPIFKPNIDYLIIPYNETLYTSAVIVSELIRDKNKSVITYTKGGKIKNAFKYADKIGANNIIFIAPNEWCDNESIIIKYLREKDISKKQVTVKLCDYINTI